MLRRLGVAGTGIAALAGCSSPEGGTGTGGEPVLEETETETEAATATEAGTPAAPETGTGAGTGTTTGTGTGTATGTGTGGVATAYEFLGVVQGWMGQAPARIADQQNPTLQLQAGQQYEVTWTNGDGVPHNFTIQDSQGNSLAQTETMSEQDASLTLTFTASREMTQYICTIHPNTMVGSIEISG